MNQTSFFVNVAYIFIFYLGAIFGSFSSVVYSRFLLKRSIVNERSECDFCRMQLKLIDLVPIFSYLILRGKCRRCRVAFGCYYISFELLCGLLFLGIYSNYKFTLPGFFFLAIYTSPLILMDLKYFRLPNSWVAMIFFAAIINYGYHVYIFGFNIMDFHESLICSALTLSFYLFLFVFTRGNGIGFGDVKLAPTLVNLAAFISWQRGFVSFLGGILLAGIVALPLYIFRYVGRKSSIPLGPFLLVGTWAAILLPDQTINQFLELWKL